MNMYDTPSEARPQACHWLGGQFCNSGGPCPKGGLGKLRGALGDERR